MIEGRTVPKSRGGSLAVGTYLHSHWLEFIVNILFSNIFLIYKEHRRPQVISSGERGCSIYLFSY